MKIKLSHSNAFTRCLITVVALCFCSNIFGQTVQISDTLRNPNNTLASGRIIVSAAIPFTAGDGTAVSTGPITYVIPGTGVINLSLYANVGADPTGTSYRARYILNAGAQYTETWVIPASGPVTIADIRVDTIPTPDITISPITQVYDASGAQGDLLVGSATAGYFVRLQKGANGECLQSTATTLDWVSCAGGLSTLREVDTNPSISNVTALEFDQADGIVVTNIGGGVARVDLANIPDAVIPDSITITLAGTATALAANGTNCPSGVPLGIDTGGNAENCAGAVRYADQFAGADAGAKIVAAIAALPTGGGTVDARGLEGAQTISTNVFAGVTKPVVLLLGAASYTSTSVQVVTANARIIGAGAGVTTWTVGTANQDAFVLSDALNAEMGDFEIVGSGGTSGVEAGIQIEGTAGLAQNIRIRGLEIRNQTIAIQVNAVADVDIGDNYIHDQVWDIGDSEGYGILTFGGASRVLIHDNHFIDVPRHAVYLSVETSESVVSNNVIQGGNRARIDIQSGTEGTWTERNQIIGNRIESVSRAVGDAAEVVHGITLGPGARNNQIVGNHLIDIEDGGIEVSGSDSLTNIPTGNQIASNLILQTTGSGRGLRVVRGTQNTVTGNTITGNAAGIGIHVSGSATHSSPENLIRGNSVRNFSIGIEISSLAPDTEIDGNSIFDSTTPISNGGNATRLGLNQIDGEAAFTTYPASPAQLTADQNNYSPSQASVWRLTSDASRTITGIDYLGGRHGRNLLLINVGAQSIVLANQNASSSSQNRIITGTGANLTLAPDERAALIYDLTTTRWRVLYRGQPAFADMSGAATDAQVVDTITLTNITQITNRAIGDTSGDLAAARVDDGGAAATQALFSGAGAAAGFRAIADGDVPDGITVLLAATATALAANGGNCGAGQWAAGVDAGGVAEGCTADDDVPDAADYSNLTGGVGIVNSPTGTLALDLSELVNSQTLFDSSQATRTVTAGLSGANDPVITFADNSISFNVPLSLSGTDEGELRLPEAAANGNNYLGFKAPASVTADGTCEMLDTTTRFIPNGCVEQIDLTADVTGVLPNSNTTAASANTASAIVARDGSGNFAAGTITAALTGTASVAATGDTATAFFSAGTIEHERGGLEADVSAYGGLVGISGGVTLDVNTEAELETALGGLDVMAVATGDFSSANLRTALSDENGTGAALFDGATSPNFAGTISGAISGNAGTATALAANGANCSAGNYPLGVDAAGAVESCTAAGGGTISLHFAVSGAAQNGTRYFSFVNPVATEANVSVGSPVGGTATEIYCNGNPASGQTSQYTFYHNASSTALTCTITGTATACSLTGQSVAITKGQLNSVQIINSATSGSTSGGCVVRVTGAS